MRTSAWLVEAERPEQPELDEAGPGLVSLHFLRHALRRRWRAWVGCAVLGMVLGAAVAVVLPSSSSATVTLLLAQPVGADPSMAMNTDVSLLRTRTVANRVIDDLGLDLEPEQLQGTVTVTVATTTVLVVEAQGPDPQEAVRRTEAMSTAFLDFRRETMELQAAAQVDRYETRLEALGKQAITFTAQYEVLSSSGRQARAQASEVLTSRAQVAAQVSELEQEIERTRITTGAVIGASGVLDPTSPVVARSVVRTTALNTTAGLIVGGSVGVGWVLLAALLSQRLRRREDVALALGASVRCSVGRLPGRLPGLAWSGPRRHAALARLVDALGAVTEPGAPVRLGLGSVQSAAETVTLASAYAVEQALQRRRVLVVDLTERGRLEQVVPARWAAVVHGADLRPPDVVRPVGVPLRAVGPSGSPLRVPPTGLLRQPAVREAWEAAEVVLSVVDTDPAVGLEHLPVWVDQMVLVVTAGRTTAERLRTTAELVRVAGLSLPFAVMVGADHHDESLGRAEQPAGDSVAPDPAPGRWGG